MTHRGHRRTALSVPIAALTALLVLAGPTAAPAAAAVPVAAAAATAVRTHAATAAVPAPAASAPAPRAAALASADPWTAVAAQRVLDTAARVGASGPIAANGTVRLRVLGVAGIPSSGVAAVVLTVTAPSPSASGTVTAWATGQPRPTVPTVRFTAGRAVTTLAVVPVGADGTVTLANQSGAALQLQADTAGWTAASTAAGGYVPVTPKRIVDSTQRLGLAGPLAAGRWAQPTIAGHAGVPATGAAAVVLSVTVVNPSTAGYLAAFPGGTVTAGGSVPASSVLNWSAGGPVTGPVVVPLSSAGAVQLINRSAAAVGLLVDVVGYVRAGTAAVGGLVALPSARIADSRSGAGWPLDPGPLPAHSFVGVKVTGTGGVPASGVAAVLLAVTVAAPTAAGTVRVQAHGGDGTGGTAVSFPAGGNRTGLALVPLTAQGIVDVLDPTDRPVQVVLDVLGYVRGAAVEPPVTWSAAAPTASGLTGVSALDCTSAAFCLAADGSGHSATFDGTAWHPVTTGAVPLQLGDLSCATATDCLAIGPHAVVRFDGARWRSLPAPTGLTLVSVSCASTSFCMVAEGEQGSSWIWNGASWSGRSAIVTDLGEYQSYVASLSCATPTLCAAVGSRNGSWLWDGASWRSSELVTLTYGTDVSCPVADFCASLAGISGSESVVYDHGTLTDTDVTWGGAMQSISCADATFCVMVGAEDGVATWDGTTWTDPAFPQTLPGSPAFVSCPTHTFCMALQRDGAQLVGRR
ncbi:hypothetical protein [Nakamurella endophytica]|uniref:Uncharacterized protein n=1 Tax=Nakamurella endophytica TaxID=1748367 RepID=A0A917WFY9_9ACTN|nr:hypothetical protein [Nakamurella endophytica]GGM01969.1 hypothetical protein GCM10011594_22580 [Nakamurella endophytica]